MFFSIVFCIFNLQYIYFIAWLPNNAPLSQPFHRSRSRQPMSPMKNNNFHKYMGVEPKIGVVYPPNHPILRGFGTILNHPFWGTLIFGNTHIKYHQIMLITHPKQVHSIENMTTCYSNITTLIWFK